LPGLRIVGMITDMENLTADYRLSAEQCRRRADVAVDEVSKATWLKFAEEWVKLADEAEQSAWRKPPSASATRREQPAGRKMKS
jgi:hypothetical protein